MRVLVTGGAGFIGSHVVDALCAAGHEPVIFDVRRPGRRSAGAPEAVRGDIRNPGTLTKAVRGCDAVIHLAAAADVDAVERNPRDAEDVNARGTLNVLEAARTAGVARVIYASTVWVYSDVAADASVDETTPLTPPAHVYTATKLAGELYCRSYAALYGVETTILRFGIPYGPRARPTAVVPAFTRRALAGEPLTVNGGGAQRRPLVYVEDLADGVVRALAPCAAGRTYNLVGAASVSVLEIAEAVRDVVGDVDIVDAPGRAADFAGVEVSGARAAGELGWRPATTLHEGVHRYVQWVSRPAPVPAPRRTLAPLLRTAGVIAAALLAGVLAAVLAGYERISDGAGLVGLLALVGLPLALVTRIDWARDRRRAALVAGAMIAGATFASLIVSVAAVVEAIVRHHAVLFVAIVVVSLVGYAARPAAESG
jgi:UDP-glucose 4-epimerase